MWCVYLGGEVIKRGEMLMVRKKTLEKSTNSKLCFDPNLFYSVMIKDIKMKITLTITPKSNLNHKTIGFVCKLINILDNKYLIDVLTVTIDYLSAITICPDWMPICFIMMIWLCRTILPIVTFLLLYNIRIIMYRKDNFR